MNHSNPAELIKGLKKFKTIGFQENDQLVCYYRLTGDDLDDLEKSAQLLLLQARAAVEMLETADVTCQIMAPALAQAAEHFDYLINKVL